MFASQAQTPGTFDSTFSNEGMAIYNWQENYYSYRLIEQPDGKLLISGGKDGKYFIMRINSDSTLDASFGINGIAEDSLPGYYNNISAMQLAPNGTIVVSLTCSDASFTNQAFAYARYLDNGIIDSTFGTNGYVLKAPSANGHYKNLIFPELNNQYIIGESIDSMGNYTTTYERLNYDGTIDPTFGNAGNVILSNFLMEGSAWLVQGKFIFYGFEEFATGYSLIRFNSNGALDSSYGTNGYVLEPFMSATGLSAIFADSTGNVFTILQFGFPNWIYRISKFDSAGVKDAGFGIAGDKDFTDRFINSLAFEPGGKIIAGGNHTTATGIENLLQRWLPDGTPDVSFANAGELLFTSATPSSENVLSVLLSTTGKIYTLSSGFLQLTQDNFFFVSRFHNDLGTGIHTGLTEQNDFMIYPNPANDEFTVSGSVFMKQEKIEMKVLDAMGKELLKPEVSGIISKTDVSKFENGIYFLELKSKSHALSKKIIVQH